VNNLSGGSTFDMVGWRAGAGCFSLNPKKGGGLELPGIKLELPIKCIYNEGSCSLGALELYK
jgi:hypothetical protein